VGRGLTRLRTATPFIIEGCNSPRFCSSSSTSQTVQSKTFPVKCRRNWSEPRSASG
jgi:hypothetical protein